MIRLVPAVAFLVVLALGGRAPAAPVRNEIVTAPTAGTETVARKGEAIASTSALEAVDAIVTTQAYTAGGMTVPPGRLSLWLSYPTGRLYQAFGSLHRDAPPGESNLVVGGIFVPNEPGRPPQLYRMDIAAPVFYDAPGIVFTETRYQRNSLNSTRRDLVFTGLADGRVGLLLREFEGDMVRPLRTAPVSVGAAPGQEVQHGGARIRILSATDVEVRYVLLAPLDPVVPPPQIVPDYPDPSEDHFPDEPDAAPSPLQFPPGSGQSI